MKNLTIDRTHSALILTEMTSLSTSQGRILFAKITGAWGYNSHGRTYVTVKLTAHEQAVIGERVPGVVRSPRYVARYRCDTKSTLEVVVRSHALPAKRRTLRTAGGKARFTMTALRDTHNKESTMAAKNSRTKAKSKSTKQVDEDLDDELEGLEELEEIEDIEEDEVEVEEPEDEEEDEVEEDEEEEEPAPPPKRGRKTKAKAKAKTTRRRSPSPGAPEPEEDDEDEEEEPAPRKAKAKAKTSKSTPKAKSAAKGKTAKAKAKPPMTRELPAGRLSATDVAAMADTEARNLRMFLRANEDQFPKDEELGRYSFTKTEAKALVKAFKAR